MVRPMVKGLYKMLLKVEQVYQLMEVGEVTVIRTFQQLSKLQLTIVVQQQFCNHCMGWDLQEMYQVQLTHRKLAQ